MKHNPNQQLSGKIAVVTGASKGIGAGIAKHLAQAGASVVVNYSSSKDAADQVVGRNHRQRRPRHRRAGQRVEEGRIERLFAETQKAFGRPDILVNNAGIYEIAPLEGITEEHFYKQFNLNVLGLLLATQEAVRRFGDAGGSIVNISSVVSTLTPPNASVYSATKASVDAITHSLAKELASRKIRVNAVNPGMVETEGLHAAGIAGGEMRKQFESQIPLGRIGQPRGHRARRHLPRLGRRLLDHRGNPPGLGWDGLTHPITRATQKGTAYGGVTKTSLTFSAIGGEAPGDPATSDRVAGKWRQSCPELNWPVMRQ